MVLLHITTLVTQNCQLFSSISYRFRDKNFLKQVVPRVGRPTVMMTVNKQMVMKKKEIMNK